MGYENIDGFAAAEASAAGIDLNSTEPESRAERARAERARGDFEFAIYGRPSTDLPIDPNDREAVQDLALRTAPMLVLPDDGNDNLPADPQAFIEHSEVKEDIRGPWHRHHGQFTPEEIGSAPDDYFLDLDDDQRGQLGTLPGPGQAPIFYELDLDAESPTMTYFFFYAYNDAANKHEGDWERVTVVLDSETLKPESVRYSAHHHSTEASYIDASDPETGRPIVYVAGHSHASYVTPGEHDTELQPFKDNTVRDPQANEHGAADSRIPLSERELDGAVIYDTSLNLAEVTEQPWYPQDGGQGLRWGDDGYFEFSGGPRGPSEHKGAVEPIEIKPHSTPPNVIPTTTIPPSPETVAPTPTLPDPQTPVAGTTTTTSPG